MEWLRYVPRTHDFKRKKLRIFVGHQTVFWGTICLIISGHPKDSHANSHETMIINLVGGFNPSETYELVSWDDYSHGNNHKILGPGGQIY